MHHECHPFHIPAVTTFTNNQVDIAIFTQLPPPPPFFSCQNCWCFKVVPYLAQAGMSLEELIIECWANLQRFWLFLHNSSPVSLWGRSKGQPQNAFVKGEEEVTPSPNYAVQQNRNFIYDKLHDFSDHRMWIASQVPVIAQAFEGWPALLPNLEFGTSTYRCLCIDIFNDLRSSHCTTRSLA